MCVHCFGERACSDHFRTDTNGQRLSDDGLCQHCRDHDRAGIPTLPPGFTLPDEVAAYCQHLTDHYPAAAPALLHDFAATLNTDRVRPGHGPPRPNRTTVGIEHIDTTLSLVQLRTGRCCSWHNPGRDTDIDIDDSVRRVPRSLPHRRLTLARLDTAPPTTGFTFPARRSVALLRQTGHQSPTSPQSLSAWEVHAATSHPWLDFLSDHYSSIWLLCWLAILVYWARPLTESRCRCSNHHRHRARYEVVQNRSRTATPRHQAIGVPRYPGPSRPPLPRPDQPPPALTESPAPPSRHN